MGSPPEAVVKQLKAIEDKLKLETLWRSELEVYPDQMQEALNAWFDGDAAQHPGYNIVGKYLEEYRVRYIDGYVERIPKELTEWSVQNMESVEHDGWLYCFWVKVEERVW